MAKQDTTIADVEHVIVLDGHTDVDALGKKNTKNAVVLVSKAHIGVSAARNMALNYNKTMPTYVCYLDADNWMADGFVTGQIQLMHSVNTTRALAACGQTVYRYDTNGGIVNTFVRYPYMQNIDVISRLLETNWIDLNTIMHPYDVNARFDTKLTRLVDWDFILQLMIHDKLDFITTDAALSNYRMGACKFGISQTEDFDRNRNIMHDKWLEYSSLRKYRS